MPQTRHRQTNSPGSGVILRSRKPRAHKQQINSDYKGNAHNLAEKMGEDQTKYSSDAQEARETSERKRERKMAERKYRQVQMERKIER